MFIHRFGRLPSHKKGLIMIDIMGILNATPDSFYDGGNYVDPQKALARARYLIASGATIIDIGGESTRPGSEPVSEEEELQRVVPILELLQNLPSQISIDTTKPNVARKAINLGARLINDVSGFENKQMRDLAASTGVDICVMHKQGSPKTMQKTTTYPQDIVDFLMDWFGRRIDLLLKSGIDEKQIILDPGIGFGKTVDDNVKILLNIKRFKGLGFRVLVGLSRKSFMAKILKKKPSDLLPATLLMNTIVLMSGASIIRVHDTSEHKDLVDLIQYIRKIPGVSLLE